MVCKPPPLGRDITFSRFDNLMRFRCCNATPLVIYKSSRPSYSACASKRQHVHLRRALRLGLMSCQPATSQPPTCSGWRSTLNNYQFEGDNAYL
jgi:hypothetical protein